MHAARANFQTSVGDNTAKFGPGFTAVMELFVVLTKISVLNLFISPRKKLFRRRSEQIIENKH